MQQASGGYARRISDQAGALIISDTPNVVGRPGPVAGNGRGVVFLPDENRAGRRAGQGTIRIAPPLVPGVWETKSDPKKACFP